MTRRWLFLQEDRWRSLLFSGLLSLSTSSGAVSEQRFPVLFRGEEGQETILVEKLGQTSDVIWSFEFLDTDSLLLAEKSGKLRRMDLKTGAMQAVTGLPSVRVLGQGGLMDLKKHLRYPEEPWIYATYSEAAGLKGARTVLGRFQLKKDQVVKHEVLLRTNSATTKGQHFGSRIAFGAQEDLFFSVGDRGERQEAQNKKNHQGKILRLKWDGSVPKDNPFVKDPQAKPEIWSWGHRNPQGLFFDQESQKLFAIEHGPRGGDEINEIKKGMNYGWPIVSFGREYHIDQPVGVATAKEGFESPIYQFTPSIAPSSLLIYSGRHFKSWKGDFFSGSLVLTHLNKLQRIEKKLVNEQRFLKALSRRVRAVSEGPEGEIFLSTDRGEILRLRRG